MIRWALVAGLVSGATTATAFDRMLLGDCQASYEQLGALVAPNDPKTAQMVRSVEATPDGWCRITGGDPGFETAQFDTFAWRSDDTARWTRDGIPPLALQVRVTGLNPDDMQDSAPTDRPDITAQATLRQSPDAGQVVLEQLIMDNGAGDVMSVSGVFDRVFLSSPSMMQVSVGSVAFKAGLFSMTLEGTHENPFGFGIDVTVQGDPQRQRDVAFEVISRLPDGVIDDASRAELTAYAGDLPSPVGTLEVVAASERGLGLMQVGASLVLRLSDAMNPDEVADRDQLEILLDGLTVTASWSPAVAIAD